MKTINKTCHHNLFILGIVLCLASALLMVSGSILGDRTTGIAIVITIIGIGLVSTNRKSRTDKAHGTAQNRSTQSDLEVKT